MTNKIVFILSFALFLLSFPTKVLATEYEELTYDDLVTQLSTKKEQEVKKSHPSSIKSHLSVGLLNTFTQIGANDTVTRPRRSRPSILSGKSRGFGFDYSERARWKFAIPNRFQREVGQQTHGRIGNSAAAVH